MGEHKSEHMTVRADSPTARTLRYLQILDGRAKLDPTDRRILMLACEILAHLIGLDCTSEDPTDPDVSHGGVTCPIHEWLVEEDGEHGPSKRSIVNMDEVFQARAFDALREALETGDTGRLARLIEQIDTVEAQA